MKKIRNFCNPTSLFSLLTKLVFAVEWLNLSRARTKFQLSREEFKQTEASIWVESSSMIHQPTNLYLMLRQARDQERGTEEREESPAREVRSDADVGAGDLGGGDEVDAPRCSLLFLLGGGLGRWISGRGGGRGRYCGGGSLAREGGARNFGGPEGGGEAHLSPCRRRDDLVSGIARRRCIHGGNLRIGV
jgi:hypothetical protein